MLLAHTPEQIWYWYFQLSSLRLFVSSDWLKTKTLVKTKQMKNTNQQLFLWYIQHVWTGGRGNQCDMILWCRDKKHQGLRGVDDNTWSLLLAVLFNVNVKKRFKLISQWIKQHLVSLHLKDHLKYKEKVPVQHMLQLSRSIISVQINDELIKWTWNTKGAVCQHQIQ